MSGQMDEWWRECVLFPVSLLAYCSGQLGEFHLRQQCEPQCLAHTHPHTVPGATVMFSRSTQQLLALFSAVGDLCLPHAGCVRVYVHITSRNNNKTAVLLSGNNFAAEWRTIAEKCRTELGCWVGTSKPWSPKTTI